MEQQSIFDRPNVPSGNQQPLPNATTVLILGILSIVICGFLGIAGIIFANKDIQLYKANPGTYDMGSYNNLKAGKTCAIVGLILHSLLYLLYGALIAVMVIKGGFK
jgi:hypothetical protein